MNENTEYEVEGLLGFLYMTSQMGKAGKLYVSAFELLWSAVADNSTHIFTFQRRFQEERNKKSRNVQARVVK